MQARRETVILLIALGCAAAWAGPGIQPVRKTLDSATEIQGRSCAKGYAWFYDDGRLERCTVDGDTAFGEVRIPSDSIIVLDRTGNPKYAMLSRDWPILGLKCRGGGWLGPAEGATTAFYSNGQPKECWLAGDQFVQGVPCRDSFGFWNAVFGNGTGGVNFYHTGRLKSCTLSRDFAGLKRGQRFVQGP